MALPDWAQAIMEELGTTDLVPADDAEAGLRLCVEVVAAMERGEMTHDEALGKVMQLATEQAAKELDRTRCNAKGGVT